MRSSVFHVDQIFVSGWNQDNFLVCNVFTTNYFHDIKIHVKDNVNFSSNYLIEINRRITFRNEFFYRILIEQFIVSYDNATSNGILTKI